MDMEMSMVSISKAGNVIRRARLPHLGQGVPGLAGSCDESSGFWRTSFSVKPHVAHFVHSIQSIIDAMAGDFAPAVAAAQLDLA